MKHYFQAHVVRLISRANPIKFVMSKPILSDRLARWYLQFQQFEIVYIPQKSVKGQELADFLADHPIPNDWELIDEFPDEDVMLIEKCTLTGLHIAAELVFGDSQSMTNQLLGSYECHRQIEKEYIENKLDHIIAIVEAAKEDCRQPIIDYLCYGILPENPRRRTDICRRAPRFLYYKDTLYRRSFEGMLLRYLGEEETIQALQEARSGEMRCLSISCEFHSSATRSIAPNPRYIITDNGKPFDNKLMNKICDIFDFKLRKSSMYHAATNCLAEAFNKTLCNLLKKVVSKSKRDWHERMEEALWAYRTTYRTPTQATPYSLAFGVEVVLPLERQIPSLRLSIKEGLTEEENAQLCIAELKALDEKRLEAQQNLECYQACLSRAFNQKVRLRCFQVGDQVLAIRRPIITSHKSGGKFTSKWDGSYVVQESYSNGAYKLVDVDGLRTGPINAQFLKRYYP
ncbi:uncharacterized protein [Solanum lycopersicum]|uniref:uncharacterized protein n=1 Tax=Solanum lycopersicum TaxID=4081 RepID=UPI003749A5AD